MFSLLFIILFAHSAIQPSQLRQDFSDRGVDSLSYSDQHDVDPELSELGRLLFFDIILSGNKNISCATCHHPTLGTSDGLALPFGEGGNGLGPDRKLDAGRFIPRNAPAAFNMIYSTFDVAMWDGRISFVEESIHSPEPMLPNHHEFVQNITNLATLQAHFPVTSHDEMRGLKGTNEIADAPNNFAVWERLTARVFAIPYYVQKFKKLFPEAEEFNYSYIASAIGAFEMTAFDAGNSSFDKFMEGDDDALTSEQLLGAEIFLKEGSCIQCHSGSHFTDFKFHALAVPQLGPGKKEIPFMLYGEDLGLSMQTNNESDIYKFKTPTLRNTSITGPWFHTGAFNSLYDVISHHANPVRSLNMFIFAPKNYVEKEEFLNVVDRDLFRNNTRLLKSSRILTNINLDANKISLVVEFLNALTDESFKDRAIVPEEAPSGLPVAD